MLLALFHTLVAQPQLSPKFELITLRPPVVRIDGRRVELARPNPQPQRFRMNGGTTLVLDSRGESFEVLAPNKKPRTVHPKDNFAEWTKLENAEKLFGSEQGRRYARECSLGTLSGFVNFGTHGLAVLNWVNTFGSFNPSWFQHLVRITPKGEIQLLKPLMPSKAQRYFGGPPRLWTVGDKIYLHDEDQLQEIDSSGKVLKNLPVDLNFGGKAVTGSKWLLFRDDDGDAGGGVKIFDSDAQAVLDYRPPHGAGSLIWGGAWLVFLNSNEGVIRAVHLPDLTEVEISGHAMQAYIHGDWLFTEAKWAGLEVFNLKTGAKLSNLTIK